jgi:hypothetical protein
MQNSSKINTVRDFAVDHPDLIVISADPATDELFVTYKGKAVYGLFEGGVVQRSLTPESFQGAWQEFSDTLATVADIDSDKGAKFMNGILDGIQGIGEALSTKTKDNGKSKKGATSRSASRKGSAKRTK